MKEIISQLAVVTVEKVNETSNDNLKQNITDIINAVIAALGIVAVVVIVLGGVQYMTSTGDSTKVKKAKDTILYGIVGLIICVLAYAIVNFVIGKLGGE
jgi:uncharacterized membrane protein